ncbi:hypothetical protein [Rhodoplanes roseus]|uniref:Uncharacterized protein n=1 Tax=Rhodoplanes roseus TaxID=29409 RepID=A0A327L4D4_9BRAD|nr:hypothetical protein [Rhodoplanes roseus]RAI44693.1 hypothetical protein CH341_07705 [Rhodoplanes roseus]
MKIEITPIGDDSIPGVTPLRPPPAPRSRDEQDRHSRATVEVTPHGERRPSGRARQRDLVPAPADRAS